MTARNPAVGPNIRIIPRLDIKGTNLVKGIHLEGLRVLGQPADFARAYYAEGADELVVPVRERILVSFCCEPGDDVK